MLRKEKDIYNLRIYFFDINRWPGTSVLLHYTNSLWDGIGFPFATLGGKVVLVLLQSKEGAGKGMPLGVVVHRSVDFIL